LFYLIAAILSSSIIFICFKLFERYQIDTLLAITINYLVAAGLGFSLCPAPIDVAALPDQPWIWLALLSGCMLMITFVVYGTSVQKVGMAITSVSGKMSVIMPVILGLLWYHESAAWTRIVGIVIALAAFFMALYRKERSRIRSIYFFLPILLFIGNGLNDSFFKIAEQSYITDDFIYFLAVSFSVSLILGIVLSTSRAIVLKRVPHWHSLLAGLILGLLNWYSTYFFLKGMRYFEVSFFVPVFNIAIVVLAALTGFLFFKEKPGKINIAGILLAIAAIVLMAV
jgi:drug/metabolite transporter (DMT)-like permease